VRGKLFIEHMNDFPIKVLPPKYTKVGKEIKVRVFNVDANSRCLEFTKKETLLKPKSPVYQSYKDALKGAKIVGVVVD
jgi:ribosomal protein S1